VCLAFCGTGDEQREEKGETSGEDGTVSFEAQEDGPDVEERKEKLSSNIIAESRVGIIFSVERPQNDGRRS
jgi:hypothetical protein